VGVGERARYWRHPAEPGVDLLSARFVRHAFARHSHDHYAIGLVLDGVEEFAYGGSVERAAAGEMPLVNPGTVHTGHAGVPDGWTYRVMYPSVEVMAEVAAEVGLPPGTPAFTGPVLRDPEAARLLLAAHAAADQGDPLASSSLMRLLFAALLRRHGDRTPAAAPATAGGTAVAQARELLHARMADPPKLAELAAAVGARPFPLLRAFRDAHGLPPHAYLNQERIRAARRLLDTGAPLADTAYRVGFVDQAHLTRHFRRIVGITPGAYRRERLGPERP
jgi:AraC-like DNA-binding protein